MTVNRHPLLAPEHVVALVGRRSIVIIFVFFVIFRYVNFLVRLITVKAMVPRLERIMIHIPG